MADAHALEACGCGRAGSNPASPTRRLLRSFDGWQLCKLHVCAYCVSTVYPHLSQTLKGMTRENTNLDHR